MTQRNFLKLYSNNMSSAIKLKQYFLLFVLSVAIFIFSYGGLNYSFFSLLLFSLSFTSVTIITSFVIVLNSIDIIKSFDNNYNFICRFSSKKNYMKMLLKNIIFSNSVMITILLFLLITGSIIASSGNFEIPYPLYNHFPFLISMIYYIVKFFLLFNLIGIFSAYIYKIFSSKFIIFYLIYLILCCSFVNYNSDIIIQGIFDFPIFFSGYLTVLTYSHPILDILAITLYCSLLLMIINTFDFIYNKKNGDLLK